MGIKYVDPYEFRSEGYLQEVNRKFFHPLGLAMEVAICLHKDHKEEDCTEIPKFNIQDWRSDLEGVFFDPKDVTENNIDYQINDENITDQWRTRLEERQKYAENKGILLYSNGVQKLN